MKMLTTVLIIMLSTTLAGCSAESGVNSLEGGDWYSIFHLPTRSKTGGGIEVADDMRYYSLSDGDPETRVAMAVVNEALRADPKPGWTQNAYPRFRVGSMAFVEVRSTPIAGVRDLSGSSEYVVVVLDDEPQLHRTPNAALFARFATVVRADPDLLELRHRIRTALTLTTGSGDYISDDWAQPTWTDEDGILTIRYYRYNRGMSDMVRPTILACEITVDENQSYTIERIDVGYEIPEESPFLEAAAESADQDGVMT